MSSRLPERINPIRLADQGAHLTGELGLQRMARLAGLLTRPGGAARVSLRFARDAHGRVVVTGCIAARVFVICQRCLEPVELDLQQSSLNLAVLSSDAEAGMLPADLDPLVFTDEALSLLDLVEEELLLVLPQEPMHATGACADRHSWHSGDAAPESSAAREPHPFAVLERLKRRN